MRKLTGRWRLKKHWYGFTVIVETIQAITCWQDLTEGPEFIVWEKARKEDLVELNINCI